MSSFAYSKIYRPNNVYQPLFMINSPSYGTYRSNGYRVGPTTPPRARAVPAAIAPAPVAIAPAPAPAAIAPAPAPAAIAPAPAPAAIALTPAAIALTPAAIAPASAPAAIALIPAAIAPAPAAIAPANAHPPGVHQPLSEFDVNMTVPRRRKSDKMLLRLGIDLMPLLKGSPGRLTPKLLRRYSLVLERLEVDMYRVTLHELTHPLFGELTILNILHLLFICYIPDEDTYVIPARADALTQFFEWRYPALKKDAQ